MTSRRTSCRVVIPILNHECVLPSHLRSGLLTMGSNAHLSTIDEDDFGALDKHLVDSEYRSLLIPSLKSVSVKLPAMDRAKWADHAAGEAVKAQFVLNLLSTENPVIVCYAGIVTEDQVPRVLQLVELDPVANLRQLIEQEYRIKASLEPAAIDTLSSAVWQACATRKQTLVALRRYNASLTRAAWPDRIIDMTICLEALLGIRAELAFRFALYLAFMSENLPERRQQAFDLFGKLYKARSNLVHGTEEERAIGRVEQDWPEVVRLAKEALLYYLVFMRDNTHAAWEKHLEDLVVGIATPVLDR